MKLSNLLFRLHSRLGDFWWYSLMLFCAARAADCLNVFVGLWLVPKYVPPSELGAVMPLSNFANFLAIPIIIFASAFRNELTTLALGRKLGQLKTLMRGVFVATAIFMLLALVICNFALPAYLKRIRVAEGSLGMLIVFCAFVTAVTPVYVNSLQALRKFKTNAVISLLGAPIRLLVMLAAMPFRALSGYFVGQASNPMFSIIAAIFGLRKELSIPAEPYWSIAVFRRISRLLGIFAISCFAGGLVNLVETTVLRQRLPELDSAAYYMSTRFSDIASFLATTLGFTLFPFTAELAAKGRDVRPLVAKASLAVIATNASLALGLGTFGRQILTVLPHGTEYAAYWWAMPWIVGIVSINWVVNFYAVAETSAFRFGYLKWWATISVLYPVTLLLVTGHGYFSSFLPGAWVDFLSTHNVTSLSAMLWWMTAFNALKFLCCVIAMLRTKQADT